MLSSAQVAAMMAQQNQMFMGMQQYSQVISAQMPQMYGIGQYGMQQPMAPQFAQVPFSPMQRPGFSYGGQAFGYGMGNQMGAAGVAALGGAGQFALGGLGIAGGLGLMGRAGSLAFDPISAGMAGFRLGGGGALGMGLGGLAAGAVAAPMMLAQHALGSMVTGAQEQAGVNSALGQFNFFNSGSRSGRGFSRQDAQAIGAMAREMQSLPEMMTSMSELTRIMDKMGQMGMMQGVHDAQAFSKKFRETISVLKDVSKMMGSTMEEAMQSFQESRQAGFYSPQAIRQNILQRQIVGGLTGMNQQQVAQMQQYGAEVSHQMGGSRVGGARGITRIAGELGAAQQLGLLSNDQLMEMTGQEGAAGIQALAGSLNDAGQRMGRSSLGTAMTLALGETKDGRYTGNMDQDLVRRVRSGEIGKSELLRLAHQKSAGRNAKLSFAAHRQRLTSEMVNSAGAQGISMELGEILGERGFDNPDALNLVMQRYGVGEEQANQIIGLMKQMPQIQRGMADAGQTAVRSMAEQAFMRENASFEGISRKIGKKFENALSEPFKKMGVTAANAIGEAVDNFTDELFGRYSTRVTQLASSTVLKARMGDKAAQSMIASGKGGLTGGGQMLMATNPMQSAMNFLSGQQTTGEVQANILESMGSQYYGTTKGTAGVAGSLAGGADVLDKRLGLMSESYITTTQRQRNLAIASLEGANNLTGKIDTSTGAGAAALQTVTNELLNNPDLRKEGLTDEQKLKILEGKLGPGVINELKKQTGSDNVANIIDALASKGKLTSQTSMFSRKGLANALRGSNGDLASISKQVKSDIDNLGLVFGDKSALAKSVFTEGGDTAKILRMAFAGGDLGAAVQRAIGEGAGTAVDPAVLKMLGMTQKQFDESRDSALQLMQANKGGNATGAGIQKVLSGQAAIADVKTDERFKEVGRGLNDRLGGVDIGGLSKTGQGLAARLKSLAGGLAGGQGFSGDTSDLISALASYTGNDKTKLMGIAGEEIGAGVQEVTAARRAYSHSRSTKGGNKSVEAFIEKMGLTGDVAAHVRQLASGGGSADISAGEAKEIEKFLGSNAAMSMSVAKKGGEQSTINAGKTLQDYLKQSSDNMAKIGTILDGIVTKQGGGGK